MRSLQILIAALGLMCCAGVAGAQSTTVDKTTSAKLTSYLHKHRLPMVGAQVSETPSGRHLMLYGFVATDFGKEDAVTKSRRYLHNSPITVLNNIRVNPQLKHLKRPPSSSGGASGPMDSAAMPPPRADWENTLDDTLRSGGASPSNDPALKMPAPGGPAPVPPGASW